MTDDLFTKFIAKKPQAKPKPKATTPAFDAVPLLQKARQTVAEKARTEKPKVTKRNIKTKYGVAEVEIVGYEDIPKSQRAKRLDDERKAVEAYLDKENGKVAPETVNPYDPGKEPDLMAGIMAGAAAYLNNKPEAPIFNKIGEVAGKLPSPIVPGQNLLQTSRAARDVIVKPATELVKSGLRKTGGLGSGDAVDQLITMGVESPLDTVDKFGDMIDPNVDYAGKLQGFLTTLATGGGIAQSAMTTGAKVSAKIAGGLGKKGLKAVDAPRPPAKLNLDETLGADEYAKPRFTPIDDFRDEGGNPFLPPTAAKEPNPFLPPASVEELAPVSGKPNVTDVPKSEPTNPFLPPAKVDTPATKPTMVEEVVESVDDGEPWNPSTLDMYDKRSVAIDRMVSDNYPFFDPDSPQWSPKEARAVYRHYNGEYADDATVKEFFKTQYNPFDEQMDGTYVNSYDEAHRGAAYGKSQESLSTRWADANKQDADALEEFLSELGSDNASKARQAKASAKANRAAEAGMSPEEVKAYRKQKRRVVRQKQNEVRENDYVAIRKNKNGVWVADYRRPVDFVDVSELPPHIRNQILDLADMKDSDFYVMTKGDFRNYNKFGQGRGHGYHPKKTSEIMYGEVDASTARESIDAMKMDVGQILVPSTVIREFRDSLINDVKNIKYKHKAADVKTFYGDFVEGVKHYTPPDKPIKAPKVETPTPKAKEVVDIEPKTTGVSNAANEADVEMGLLDNAPEGKGRKATEIYEQNRTREDYQDVAKRIADGEALTADNIATVLAGNQKITKRVTDARLALKEGIDAGLPDAKVRELQRAYDQAKIDKMEFLENVQKGKSEWSNIGRVLAKRTDIDTGDIEQVLEEARLQKGRDLTDAEVEQWQTVVNEHKATISALEARLDAVLRGRKDAISDTGILRRLGKGKEGIRAERTLARSDLLKVLSRTSGIIPGGGDPEAVIELYKYLKTFIAEGVEGIDDLLKKAKADLADTDAAHIDREDIVQALTKKPVARKLSELQDSLKKLRAEAKALSEPEPKPKVNNAEYNKRVREYARTGRAGDAEVKAKINRTTELEKEIKEIQELIAKGEYFENQPKKLREVDKEVFALEMKRKLEQDKLKTMLQDLKPKSKSEKVGTFLTSLKIVNLSARLNDFLANTQNFASTVRNIPAEWVIDKASAKILNETPLLIRNKGFSGERRARYADRVKAGIPDQFNRVWGGIDKASKDRLAGGGGLGGKLAGSTDAIFYVAHKERAIDMFADVRARQILGEGAKQADIADMRDSIIRDLDNHPDIAMQAEEYALYKTFNNNNVLTKIANTTKQNLPEAGKVFLDETLFRFGKVLTNVAMDTFDRTGFGLVRGGAKLALAKNAGKSLSMADRAIINDMMSKGLVGGALLFAGKVIEEKTGITEKLGLGKVKGEKVKYMDWGDIQNLGGDGAIMLLGATMARAAKMENPEEGQALVNGTFWKMPFNNPTTSSVDDIIDFVNSGSPKEFNKYIAKKLTNTVIPGQARDIAARMDTGKGFKTGNEPEREKVPKEINPRTNKERQTGDFLKILQGEAMSKTPILRQRLPVKKEKSGLVDPDKNKTKV